VTSREQLRVQGTINSTSSETPPGISGTNTFRFRIGKTPIVTGTVTPPAIPFPMATCSRR